MSGDGLLWFVRAKFGPWGSLLRCSRQNQRGLLGLEKSSINGAKVRLPSNLNLFLGNEKPLIY